jgi:hypothetical protein
MYMSDLEPDAGGETVFPKGWPPGVAEEDRMDPKMVRFLFYRECSRNKGESVE